MPIYEYVCEQDGTVIERLRPIADADKPIADLEGKGRTFTRRLSTFAAQSPSSTAPTQAGCRCGNPAGPCARG